MSAASVSPTPKPYGSAKDLPSYRELNRQIQVLGSITHLAMRTQRKPILAIRHDLDRLVAVVDEFYDRLGVRQWIFHDLLNIAEIEKILAQTTTAEAAEQRLIELYRDRDTLSLWILRLNAHHGLKVRRRQIQRAFEHYFSDEFDSATLQLIAVMDGFVNDFQPAARRGLAAREPAEMVAWDSVVGHHLGLTHAMRAFRKTFKKRVDVEVFEVHRHGMVHGSIVNFDNVVVATKAWCMLFAVSDWARATTNAAAPALPEPSWDTLWPQIQQHCAQRRFHEEFVPSQLLPGDPGFDDQDVVVQATAFLRAWQHQRWGLVAGFAPPPSTGQAKQSAVQAKAMLERHRLGAFTISRVCFDVACAAKIHAKADLDGVPGEITFRMVSYGPTGALGIPGEPEVDWLLATWMAPRPVKPELAG
ncbi:hypothetical protein HGA13_29745 [Nocardia speluncae]|uniref:Uncharacterized protein n=1 Tax=Nocardia speluncae TaxID=419477 RepID=A0A846XUM9_9NOCA|nr:hypothetical protein [Nocardia speluncae]NKY37224.1 hypothetical protein [Nocardia speluncae]